MTYSMAEGRLSVASGGEARRTVAVVDDSDEFVDLLTDVLDGHCVVKRCPDASVAAIAATRPDVLVIDPWTADHGTDGWAFLGRVRSDATLRRVPIIVCAATPLEGAGGLERLRNQTDVWFISKPFALEQLEDVVAQAAGAH